MPAEQDPSEDTLPTPLLTTALYGAAGALVASFVVKITSSQVIQGEVVSFRDWGAVAFGAVALLAALASLPAARSPLEPQHRTARLACIAAISVLALYRLLYGLGMFA